MPVLLFDSWAYSSSTSNSDGSRTIIYCHNVRKHTIGLATPAMGLVLFVSASLTGDKVEVIAKEMLPFLRLDSDHVCYHFFRAF